MVCSDAFSVRYLLVFSALCGAWLLLPDLTFAGTGGTEFNAINDRLQGIIEGGGGKLAAGIATLFGIGALVKGWSLPVVVGVAGVGAAVAYGYPVVTGVVTATI